MGLGRITFGFCALAVLAAASLQGCADPTAGKTAAIVGEASGSEASAAEAGAVYVLTKASRIDWVGSKVTGHHDGGFHEFIGTITVPEGDLRRARIESAIQTDSIWSDNDRLTAHLKSADFFEVETYPEARFVSTGMQEQGGAYMVTGDLTLHGVTKSITFPMTVNVSGETLTANAEFSLNRFDFGINYAGRADDLIRENVLIKLHLVAAPPAA